MASTPRIAYSYIRFSRDHQSEGDSLRRQLEATRNYCARKGLALDESLNLQDLGISAFKGDNAETGALSRFLEAVKAGKIAPGSALVVESIDRLSRQDPWESVSLLKKLKDYGIEVHLTMADMIISPSEPDDGMKLMYAVAMASRAHDESKTKSKRLLEAFEAKRKKAAGGDVFVAKSLPWWLEYKGGKITSPPERAAIVKRIFELTAQGKSSSYISRLLNSEKVKTWRPTAKQWSASRVRDLIRGDSALGTLSETKKTKQAGRKYKLVGYYPRLITDELAAEARAAMLSNRVGEVGRAATGLRPINLFRGLLRHKGRWMRFQTNRNGEFDPIAQRRGFNGYYDVVDPDSSEKVFWGISSNQLEPVIIRCLAELKPEDILPAKRDTAPSKSSFLRASLTDLEARRVNLLSALESGSTSVSKRLVEVEGQIADLRKELAAAETLENSFTPTHSTGLKDISLDLKSPETRKQTAAALRKLITRIDVGRTFQDIPIDTKLYEAWLAKSLNLDEPSVVVSDPIPYSKRRKELSILITFRSGAQRIISRLDCSDEDNNIYSARIDSSEDAHLFPPYPKKT